MLVATFIQDLRQPEYIHVLLNPLPVYGLVIALGALVIGLIQRSRQTQIAALILTVVVGLSVWPVTYFGEAGFDRVESLSDDQGETWLKVHAHRGDQVGLAYYLLAGIAVLAILLPLKWPRSARILALITVLCSLGALAAGSYISYAGGRVRHREFRTGPPPPAPVEQDEH